MERAMRAVVIGSGAGGLAAAGYLSQAGLEVTVLEQGEHFGGYINPYFRDGFQFSPGVHYLGLARAGQPLHDVLEGLGIDPSALLIELDPQGFDEYRFPDFEVRMCRGLDAYRDRLVTLFPKERRGLDRFFDLVRQAGRVRSLLLSTQRGSLWWSDLTGLRGVPAVMRWARSTFGELLKSITGDSHLRAVLAAAGGDYGLPPGRASAIAGLMLFDYYADGAFYPRGGVRALRDALVDAAEKHGARFRANARVAKILTVVDRTTGVLLESGERIEADVVVSNADPVRTFGELLDTGVLPKALRDRVARTEASLGTFAVNLGMTTDLRAAGFGRFDIWSYPSWDIDDCYAPLFQGRLPADPVLFLSPNSLKDDSGAMAPAGGASLEIVTLAPYSLFERWADHPFTARGLDYEAEKNSVANWLLAAVDRRFPRLVQHVVVKDVSTPLTNEHYTLAVRGGAYGPAMTPDQTLFRRFTTATPIENLFLAGAGVYGDGVANCLASGEVAARAALRRIGATRRRGFAFPSPREARA